MLVLGLLAAVLLGCSDVGGLPLQLRFENRTSGAISVNHRASDGHELVLANEIGPGKFWSDMINQRGNVDDFCVSGTYVARDSTGAEIARKAEGYCSWWVIANAPIPVTITNSTGFPLTVVYPKRPEIVVANDLAPYATVSTTVQTLGDPSELCLGGFLIARDDAGHEVARHDLFRCDDWPWDVRDPTAHSRVGVA